MPKDEPTWWTVLLALREMDGDKITAYSLGKEIGMTPKMASGWLSKFASWGYVERHGTCGVSDGKWIRRFVLTEYGMERKKPAGRMVFKRG